MSLEGGGAGGGGTSERKRIQRSKLVSDKTTGFATVVATVATVVPTMDAFVKDVDEIGRQCFVQPGDLDFIGGGKRGIDIDGTLFQRVQESVQVFSFDVQTQRAVNGVGFDDETIRVRQDFAQFGQVSVKQGQGPHD